MSTIENIKALLAEATPAPWSYLHDVSKDEHDGRERRCDCGQVWVKEHPIFYGVGDDGAGGKTAVANARITAALRNAAPALIEFVELSVAMERTAAALEYHKAYKKWQAALARLTKDEEA